MKEIINVIVDTALFVYMLATNKRISRLEKKDQDV